MRLTELISFVRQIDRFPDVGERQRCRERLRDDQLTTPRGERINDDDLNAPRIECRRGSWNPLYAQN